jgi:soluble lytic murein transglycosylase-like protein
MLRSIITSEDRYDSLFQYYANGVDWLLLKAQVKAESNFDPSATSKCGAKGLAQFLDTTYAEWEDGTPGVQPPVKNYNAYDAESSIFAQAHYMKWLLDYCNGDTRFALAAYNWGCGNIHKYILFHRSFDDVVQLMPLETQEYVTKIMGFYNSYKGVSP